MGPSVCVQFVGNGGFWGCQGGFSGLAAADIMAATPGGSFGGMGAGQCMEAQAMTTAKQLLDLKGASVATLPSTATVEKAVATMHERRIGAVLVVEKDLLVGLFSERDLLRRVVHSALDPRETRLGEVMTASITVASPNTPLDEIRRLIRAERLTHVVTLDGEVILGVIGLEDLITVTSSPSAEKTTTQTLETLRGGSRRVADVA